MAPKLFVFLNLYRSLRCCLAEVTAGTVNATVGAPLQYVIALLQQTLLGLLWSLGVGLYSEANGHAKDFAALPEPLSRHHEVPSILVDFRLSLKANSILQSCNIKCYSSAWSSTCIEAHQTLHSGCRPCRNHQNHRGSSCRFFCT